jgi:hypothetical protein
VKIVAKIFKSTFHRNSMKLRIIYISILFSLLAFQASAVVINSVYVDTLSPGEEGLINLEVENFLNEDVEDVIITLQFKDTPFIPIGTSEQSVDEIEEDKDEDFIFRIKASIDVKPGDYQIPYTLQYNQGEETKKREGTIGVKITASPELTITVSTPNAIQTRQGTISVKVVNKGLYDARFVSVKILPEGFTVLSDKEVYIGEIESDDFETASFDVLFKDTKAEFTTILEYRDFDNKKVIETASFPVTVYTKEKALELGLIQKNNTPLYVGFIVTIILLWILWRTVKKRRRLMKSMQKNKE